MTDLKRRLPAIALTLALCFALEHGIGRGAAFTPDVLWTIVHDLCVPNERERGRPAPCAAVALHDGEQRGYALLKDRVGATQMLLIPTRRVTGIESPFLLTPGAPNYFAYAWRARVYLDRVLHRTLPRTDIALAVNSARGRSQNQLHIHIDCVRPGVRAALRDNAAGIGEAWAPLPVPFGRHRYIARSVEGAELGDRNPFKLLADGWPAARQAMAAQTLVVVGARLPGGAPGFVLLDDHAGATPGDQASGEELEDHRCAVARM